jgi:hypothetical protein
MVDGHDEAMGVDELGVLIPPAHEIHFVKAREDRRAVIECFGTS